MMVMVMADRAAETRATPVERRRAGYHLRQARRDVGLTLEAVGEALGVVRQSVSRWEIGRNYPTADRLQKLADLYGVSVDWLLKGHHGVAEPRAAYDATGRLKLLEDIKETADVAAQTLPAVELRRIRDLVRFMVQYAGQESQEKEEEP